jgi:5'-3' exonuclease
MRVHLIDGTYELFRAYYGAPKGRGPDGREVGAARSLLRTFALLLADPTVSHLAVAFDTVVESFRNDLFSGYKTGDGIEPELLAQFPLAEVAVSALGIVVWSMIRFEADDAIATAASRFATDPRVEQVVIGSPDKDLMQCVREGRVVVWDRMRGRVFDETAVGEKFGVAPPSIPDYLALVGDAADGIPGLPRWGGKSAAAVLARYRHIEAIPDDEAEWEVRVRGATALAQALREHRSDAMLYRVLATLRTDVPLPESLDDLEWRGAPRRHLEGFCAQVGSEGVLSRIDRWRDA